MKIILVLVLAIYCQTATAACPVKESFELTYMTKDELITFYCENQADFGVDLKDHEKRQEEVHKEMELNLPSLAKNSSRLMTNAAENTTCDRENYQKAFRALRKHHGIEEEKYILCE